MEQELLNRYGDFIDHVTRIRLREYVSLLYTVVEATPELIIEDVSIAHQSQGRQIKLQPVFTLRIDSLSRPNKTRKQLKKAIYDEEFGMTLPSDDELSDQNEESEQITITERKIDTDNDRVYYLVDPFVIDPNGRGKIFRTPQ